MSNAPANTTDSRAGKYLTFELDDEAYGIEILKVREIIGMMDITKVPRMPSHVRGVINLRGKVIPVIDLRLKFEMNSIEETPETCIIVADVSGQQMGLQVDKVCEVLDIAGNEIEDAPTLNATVDNSMILGMGKAKGRVNILLKIEQVLSTEQAVAVSEDIDLG
ncbi:MAG: purine-binding chemotaxis protein CheW [Calditrichaeota bacterium]|nr:purine-binding chemotaxis protein CheW [Calditrichota bacterium]MCB9365657.1 purine-binding chemotaxis protein CheW [Calditrichota bacterium]